MWLNKAVTSKFSYTKRIYGRPTMLLKKFNVRCFDVALPNDFRSSYIHDSFDQHSDYCSVHKKYLYGIRPDDRFDPTLQS